MPILFSCLSNHRNFPSDSESDDPDFEAAPGAAGSDDSDMETSGSDASSTAPQTNNGKPAVVSPVLALSPDTTSATHSSENSNRTNVAPKKNKVKKTPPTTNGAPRKRKTSKTGEPARKKRTKRKRSIMFAENVEGSNSLKLVLKKRPAVDVKEDDGPPACAPGLWDRSMPREILLKIFRHSVDKVGVLPFLVTMSEVCPSWKSVAQDVSLWEKVDMSVVKVTEAQLNKWSNSGMLKRVRELNLSNFGPKLSHSTIVNLVKNGPRLEILNLSYNAKLTMDTMEFVINNCENLRGIDISGTTKNRGVSASSTCCPNALKLLFTKRGSRLVQLCMAENSVASLNTVLNSIPSHLPKLEVLDLSNITTTCDVVFPLEKIQESCPELRVLRLANTQTRLASVPPIEQARSPGFRKLEELSVANVLDLGDAGLERILKSSEKLTLLDVRSCKGLSVSGLVKIPAWDMTHLYLANCAAASNPDVELIMKKWSHSLRVIDMSWVSQEAAINAALQAVATYSELPSQLYEIDIKHSSVSLKTLEVVLDKCARLKKLNLTSCPGLPSGIQRLFDAAAVSTLRADFISIKLDEQH